MISIFFLEFQKYWKTFKKVFFTESEHNGVKKQIFHSQILLTFLKPKQQYLTIFIQFTIAHR